MRNISDVKNRIAAALTRTRDGFVRVLIKPAKTDSEANEKFRGKRTVGEVPTSSGVEIFMAESRRLEWGEAASGLCELLNNIGVKADVFAVIDAEAEPNAIHIEIGKKP